jgi:hypothetical protein
MIKMGITPKLFHTSTVSPQANVPEVLEGNISAISLKRYVKCKKK